MELPFYIPKGSLQPDQRYTLNAGADVWQNEAEVYYAGGVGTLVNEAGKAAEEWGSLGMGVGFAPHARSRAETWITPDVKTTLGEIQRGQERARATAVAAKNFVEVGPRSNYSNLP
jgi:hypothetical protein